LCYDASHGHPVGGGFYYTEGQKHLLETVRERMREDPTASVRTALFFRIQIDEFEE
jgi:hypothetical protein